MAPKVKFQKEDIVNAALRVAREKGIDLVLTSGNCASEMSRAAGDRGRNFESREALVTALPELLKEGDCVLVKASKGSHFETVSAALREIRLTNKEID